MPKGVYPRSKEQNRKVARARRETWRDPEYRRKMVQVLKKRWSDPKFRKENIEAARARMQSARRKVKRVGWYVSKPQMYLFKLLCRLGVEGARLDYPVGPYFADVAIFPDKICIEVDGWAHLLKGAKDKDRRRDHYFRRHGWKVIRLPASRRRIGEFVKSNLGRLL